MIALNVNAADSNVAGRCDSPCGVESQTSDRDMFMCTHKLHCAWRISGNYDVLKSFAPGYSL